LFHFCEAILNSTNYSRRGEWLGGESSRRSCHKDGFIFLMTIKGINPMCGSLGRAGYFIISPQVYDFTNLTLEQYPNNIESRRV